MAESAISDIEKNIQNINSNKKLFLHLIKPEYIPVGTEYVSISDTDNIPNHTCDEIHINDLLDFLSYNEMSHILDMLVTKLIQNGSLTIQSADLYQLCSSVTFEDIDLDTVKMILYQNKKSIYTIYDIETELLNRGLNIIEKKYINIFEYYIKAIKV